MEFVATKLAGVFEIRQERHRDERGFFARTWCAQEFEAQGISDAFVQCNTSFNAKRGTLRGLHYQIEPHDEGKLVRCTAGRIYDVALDLREGSETFGQWTACELSAEAGNALWIPAGLAHGFQSLEDDSEVFYQMSASFAPDCARSVRWNDPRFSIEWPLANPILSEKDQAIADYEG